MVLRMIRTQFDDREKVKVFNTFVGGWGQRGRGGVTVN